MAAAAPPPLAPIGTNPFLVLVKDNALPNVGQNLLVTTALNGQVADRLRRRFETALSVERLL